MAILIVFDIPGMTQDAYQQSIVKLTGGRDAVKSSSDWPVPGLVTHTAATTPNGFFVADVWESEEAFQKFGEIIRPILEGLGVADVQPKIYPVVNLVTP
ncbi:hypothetical protein [Streptomyces sp. H39-S7]|uniref:hypothetical protein n=1 Tax=Streptomyces sp. H39-S7 TaxID=3004357 RepID=UPI0022AEE137|nr:hypothetical protein [Streptomyces sp. H39-S7]MCZ4118892.1 hypothetical protein [Streptomyces sp. H39-S7]